MLARHSGRDIRVTLLSKPECSLCDEALASISRVFGAENVTVVNILRERALEDLYVFRIPVLMRGDVVLAEGRIDVQEARRALALVTERSGEA
jgi:hypothetical protein